LQIVSSPQHVTSFAGTTFSHARAICQTARERRLRKDFLLRLKERGLSGVEFVVLRISRHRDRRFRRSVTGISRKRDRDFALNVTDEDDVA
jgi:hypothetical protein